MRACIAVLMAFLTGCGPLFQNMDRLADGFDRTANAIEAVCPERDHSKACQELRDSYNSLADKAGL